MSSTFTSLISLEVQFPYCFVSYGNARDDGCLDNIDSNFYKLIRMELLQFQRYYNLNS